MPGNKLNNFLLINLLVKKLKRKDHISTLILKFKTVLKLKN